MLTHEEQGRSAISLKPSQKPELRTHSKKGMNFETGRGEAAGGRQTAVCDKLASRRKS